MVELHELKRQISYQNHLLLEERKRNKSSNDAQVAEKLIQRVISAAIVAWQHTKTSPNGRTSNIVEQNRLYSSGRLREPDPPDRYLESDIDGLCYLGGARRRRVNSPVNSRSELTKANAVV